MKNTTSRKAALARGEFRYYTGKLCRRNHDADRYTLTGACVLCRSVYHKRRYGKPVKNAGKKEVVYQVYPELIETLDSFVAALMQAHYLDNQGK